LVRYAQLAGFEDSRFSPISPSEVPHLSASVSLLVGYETCGLYDWEIGTHGIMIKFAWKDEDYSAVYLPEVCKEQRWSREECVESLVKKSGFKGKVKDIEKVVDCTRFRSSKCHLNYSEYNR
jgi:AMME syndrome candidate gene 1 protein